MLYLFCSNLFLVECSDQFGFTFVSDATSYAVSCEVTEAEASIYLSILLAHEILRLKSTINMMQKICYIIIRKYSAYIAINPL